MPNYAPLIVRNYLCLVLRLHIIIVICFLQINSISVTALLELALTSKHVRDAFDREENNLVQRLLGKINNLTEFEQVN